MAAPRKKRTATTASSDAPVGRFHELTQQAAARRRGPYQLTADISIPALTLNQTRELQSTEDGDAQLEIVLGEHFDAVMELFGPRPIDEWVEFQNDLFAHFFGEGAQALPGGSQGS